MSAEVLSTSRPSPEAKAIPPVFAFACAFIFLVLPASILPDNNNIGAMTTTLASLEERQRCMANNVAMASVQESSTSPHPMPHGKVMLMDGAAASTNLGVQCSLEGQLSNAMEFFREALVAVKMAFADDLPSSEIPQGQLDRAAHRILQVRRCPAVCARSNSPTFLVLRGDPLNSFSTAQDKMLASLESSSDTIFCHPLSIQAPAPVDGNAPSSRQQQQQQHPQQHYYFCNDAEVDSSIFSAVIIYNMAVVTHKMIHMQPPGRRKDALRQRTNSLYDMCNQLLSNAAEQVDGANAASLSSSSSSPPPPVRVRGIGKAMYDLMTMAVVNNQADLVSDTVDHQLSLVHMDRLVQVAAAVRSQRYGHHDLDSTVQTAVEFFLSNATKARFCRFTAAAAA